MRFRKILFQKDGVPDQTLNKKLEYFHHYWSLVLHTDKRDKSLYLDAAKFDSHRSLLSNCLVELESTSDQHVKRSISNILKLYLSSGLFQKGNLFIRENLEIKKSFDKIKKELESNKDKYSRKEAVNKIPEIRNLILGDQNSDYTGFITNYLVKIFSNEKDLDSRIEQDLDFLVNALIVEFFHIGYSIDFIKRVPDIILFMEAGFPHEVFEENKIPENTQKVTLDTRLKGLQAFLLREALDGYYLFKVDGIDFQLDKPIKLWGKEIYNPKTQSKINRQGVEEWIYQSWVESELFYSGNEMSTCNILVPFQYQYEDGFTVGQGSLFKAFRSAQETLVGLNRITNMYNTIGNRHNGTIDIRNRIILSSQFYSVKSPHRPFNQVEKLELPMPQLKMAHNFVDYMNCLSVEDLLHKKVIECNSLLQKYRNEPWKFKFNELWIKAFESFFPNDVHEIKRFSLKCLILRLDRHYINYLKGFFYDSLGRQFNPLEGSYQSFSEADQIKLEILHIEIGQEIIAGNDFKQNFLTMSEKIGSRVLSKNLQMAKHHTERKEDFIKDIERWVDTVLDQVYAQRNLYAHSNSIDEFGAMKLKEDFIYLASVVIGEIHSKIYHGSAAPIKAISDEFDIVEKTYE
ncbi:hypothetical protein SYJ56_02485 [Algoriphagus sp. D3-2-R+10]|uniref:hypothetical protein n=1 Tax=Algoriphagus aurantiacus TaxID=3103948 RepID=UPI002B37A63A|nr:hypothetical protein [Algoriphagus sp. D3-2-R+10]MEB2774153.1 hypothetical protein [Algoriphagus sp. D3-2-R+10]